MERRSTQSDGRYVHFGGDVTAHVNSSHGVRLSGGSTGGIVEAVGDDTNVTLTLRAQGTGNVVISSPQLLGSGSSTPIALIQRYRIDATVPALSSASSAESTVFVFGLTTSSVMILQNRFKLNSTVTGVTATPRCSTANELVIEWHNISQSSLSGSTQSFYLLQFSV